MRGADNPISTQLNTAAGTIPNTVTFALTRIWKKCGAGEIFERTHPLSNKIWCRNYAGMKAENNKYMELPIRKQIFSSDSAFSFFYHFALRRSVSRWRSQLNNILGYENIERVRDTSRQAFLQIWSVSGNCKSCVCYSTYIACHFWVWDLSQQAARKRMLQPFIACQAYVLQRIPCLLLFFRDV